jgi:hypothetical protein
MAPTVAALGAAGGASTWRVDNAQGTVGDGLTSVSCGSRTSCLAVGVTRGGSALADWWSGHRWSQSRTAKLRSRTSSFSSVDCTSPESCWAIGIAQGNLFEHWNGKSWQVLIAPKGDWNPVGLSCATIGRCVAVGSTGAVADLAVWDGARWSVSHGAEPTARLGGVSCTSLRFCETVGVLPGSDSSPPRPIAETWHGVNWTNSRPLAPRYGLFEGVSCWSSAGCLAVGFQNSNRTGFSALIERWDGQRWSTVKTPADVKVLEDVACTTSRNCIAVGGTANGQPSILTWNGTVVRAVVTPRLSRGGELLSVSQNGGSAVAIGQEGNGPLFEIRDR